MQAKKYKNKHVKNIHSNLPSSVVNDGVNENIEI